MIGERLENQRTGGKRRRAQEESSGAVKDETVEKREQGMKVFCIGFLLKEAK